MCSLSFIGGTSTFNFFLMSYRRGRSGRRSNRDRRRGYTVPRGGIRL